jgi:hypothetical protein
MKLARAVGDRLTVLLALLIGLLLALVCFVLSLFIKQLLPAALMLAGSSGLGFLLLVWYAKLRMSPSEKAGWAGLKRVRKAFQAWARAQGITVERVEHLATFEEFDGYTGIFVFFKTNSELERLRADGGLERIERNFQGNYYYRLRG